jgi:hypothetical protein
MTSSALPDPESYDAQLYNATVHEFPFLVPEPKVHVAISRPLLSQSFSRETETRIVELVRKEIAARQQTPRPGRSQDFDISLKGLNLGSALEADLIAALHEQLPILVSGSPALPGAPAVEDGAAEQIPSNEVDEPKAGPHLLTHSLQGTCICAGTLPGSVYPVPDPTRISKSLPHVYAAYLYEDVLRIRVEHDPALSGCQMLVGLESQVQWAKEIAAWHLCSGQVSSVTTSGSNRGPNFMLLQKAQCQSGTHTIVLRKAKTFGSMWDMYTFDIDTFWAYWGGKRLTFTWFSDTQGSGKWGHQTTLSLSGGDGSLVKESGPAVYILYGGAKFWIPNPQVFHDLGFDWANVLTLPAGGLAAIPNIPRDGTLLKQMSDPAVYVIRGGSRYHISSPQRFHDLCFYWENLRIVPNGALNIIPAGGVL